MSRPTLVHTCVALKLRTTNFFTESVAMSSSSTCKESHLESLVKGCAATTQESDSMSMGSRTLINSAKCQRKQSLKGLLEVLRWCGWCNDIL